MIQTLIICKPSDPYEAPEHELLCPECGSDRLHFTWQGFDGYERCLDCGYEDVIDKFADL